MPSRGLITVLVLIAVVPVTGWCNTDFIDVLQSYNLTVGVSVSSTDFDVYNEGSSNSNGTLSEDFSYFPFATIISPYRYFGDTKAGVFMEYSFSGFNLSQQSLGGDPDRLVDLGTSVNGYYAFITPTVFYSFLQQNSDTGTDHELIMGLGIGIGYLKATGDIIFTESTNERINIDISGAALALSMFIQYRRGNLFARISSGYVSHTQGAYDYDAFGFTLDFGYTFGL